MNDFFSFFDYELTLAYIKTFFQHIHVERGGGFWKKKKYKKSRMFFLFLKHLF
jgi:hypothetical protein